jgi:predicted nuclease with RNAse H fold
VIADTLLAERDVVFRRLQRMGVQIIETRPEQFGAELVSRYLQIKRRDML